LNWLEVLTVFLCIPEEEEAFLFKIFLLHHNFDEDEDAKEKAATTWVGEHAQESGDT
jgi:hypothetical protein